MTTEASDTIEQFVISGTGPYAFSWRIFDENDLTVTALETGEVDPISLTVNSHFTVAGVNDEDGGTITLINGAETTYTGFTLDIRSNVVVDQPTSIKNQGTFAPIVHEKAFDRNNRQIQDLARQVKQSWGYPDNVNLDAKMTNRTDWLGKWPYVNEDGVIEPSVLSETAITESVLTSIGMLSTGIKYDITEAEQAAGVTIVDDYIPPGVFDRYGNNATPGTTDMSAAIQAAVNSCAASGAFGKVQGIPGSNYRINSSISNNNRSVLFEFNNCTITIGANMTYGLSLGGTACEIANVSFNRNGATVTAAIFATGLQHVFRNMTSRNQIWPIFIYGQDLKESHFTQLRVDNDVSGKTGKIFHFDYSVNNTVSDSMIGYCAQAFYGSSTASGSGYFNEGLLISNVITVYAGKAANFDNVTFLAISNCIFDFCETSGVFVSNGAHNSVSNTWIASNQTNGFIGVGSVNTVPEMSVIGCTFVRGAAAITGTAGVSLSGTNALVIGNSFTNGMNGGTVTDATSTVFGNTVTSGGTEISAASATTKAIGNLTVTGTLTVGPSTGFFPSALSGSATLGANGALPAQVSAYGTVNIGGTSYKVPLYNP